MQGLSLAIATALSLPFTPITGTPCPHHAMQNEGVAMPNLEEYLEIQNSLSSISFRLLHAASEAAPNWRHGYGLLVHDASFYKDRAVRRHTGNKKKLPWLMPWPTISYLSPDAPVAYTGLRVNDRILAVNGDSVEGETAEQLLERFSRIGKLHSQTLHVAVSRNSRIFVQTVQGVRLADYQIQVLNSNSVDAYVDGNDLVITRGMLEYAQAPEDQACVLAYVLAQSVLADLVAENENVAILQTETEKLEEKTDELAIYFLAKADFSYSNFPEFWQDLAAHQTKLPAKSFLAQNPISQARIDRLRTLVGSVDERSETKSPLLPPVVAEVVRERNKSPIQGSLSWR